VVLANPAASRSRHISSLKSFILVATDMNINSSKTI
jgi:hypothetical protein